MSSETKPPGIEHVKKTILIKNIQGKDLTVDVYYVDPETTTPQLALLYFHSGFLEACLRRKWTLVSANYRCIPESTAFELAEDLLAACSYVSTSLSSTLDKPDLVDPTRIIVVDHSGGGYCAVKATLELLKSAELPKPAATVSIYGMFDFLAPNWSVEGIDISRLSDEDAVAGEKDLKRRLASKAISFGEKFANSEAEMVNHTRWNLMRYILKKPVFVDYFSVVSGLGKKLASVQPVGPASYQKGMEEIVPLEAHQLFVVDFGNLKPQMPPLFVVHGIADVDVPVRDSDRLVEKTKGLGVPTRYWRLESLAHEFDFGFPGLEMAETKIANDDIIGAKAIMELLQGLDAVI